MIVIANNTEYRLRDDLRKILREKPTQRCFFLRFSQTDIQREKLFEAFLRILESMHNAYMAKVYLCEDKDVLIIIEGFMQRHFEEFMKKLATDVGITDFSTLLDMYEIGVHWDQIEAIYTAKIDEIENAESRALEEKRLERANQHTLAVMGTLAPDKIASVSERRLERAKPLVMIADDDQLSRTLAGNVLREHYNMSFAVNGREAISSYIQDPPDILFLDIGMPDIGGLEVLEVLFQMDPDAHIIMFSGRKDKTTILRSLNMGAQGFLGKPFTRDELYAHVGNSPHIRKKLCKISA